MNVSNLRLCIVPWVDLLMSICDKLEAGLMHLQADSERMIRAVVGRMLADKVENMFGSD